jgi:hypothetical protein
MGTRINRLHCDSFGHVWLIGAVGSSFANPKAFFRIDLRQFWMGSFVGNTARNEMTGLKFSQCKMNEEYVGFSSRFVNYLGGKSVEQNPARSYCSQAISKNFSPQQ